jgi:4-hydroxy-3-methylbut-2-enyl diphosphate reductase IspH
MTDDLVRRLREGACLHNQLEAYGLTTEAADRIEELEAAPREKDNIAYIIDSHGITHESFTIVYRTALGEKTNG